MTVGQWLDARLGAAPPALAERLQAALSDARDRPDSECTALCLDAAERILARVLATPCVSREDALELLTADALVTYALESASDRPGDLAGVAVWAMERFAASAVEPPP